MSLTLVNARAHLFETVRIPIALIGAAFFPAASMIFFVVPYTGSNPVASTFATGSMVVFAVMGSTLFGYGIGVAEDRAQPWDGYTRTLPAGPGPRFAGRILAGLVMMVLSLTPVVVIAALFTQATITLPRFLLAAMAVVALSVPFTFIGLAVGYLLPAKAALAVVQVLFLPMAFAGGLLAAPGQAPGFVEAIAPFTPSRGAVELVWTAEGGHPANLTAVIMLGVWTAVAGVVAAWAYRRDEGRRFY